MKTVQDVYTQYNIMPNLQLHQLRVAAVGQTICDHFSGEIDTNAVVLACLFHDMGNIIKSDLAYFPQFMEPEGIEYWQNVKDDFIAIYGNDEHVAANEIAKAIGLPDHVRMIIDDARFSRLEKTCDSQAFEPKIEKYCDLRVGPFGVLSLDGRLAEGKVRYAKKKGYDSPEGQNGYERSISAAREIEEQIFARCSIKPADIDDKKIAPLIEELRNYPVA